MQAEIAVLRFGLGARPQDLNSASGDPREWLRDQIQGAVPLCSETSLAQSREIYPALLAARELELSMRRAAAQAVAAEKPVERPASNAVRETWKPHYRSQVLARAQSAASTDRPF